MNDRLLIQLSAPLAALVVFRTYEVTAEGHLFQGYKSGLILLNCTWNIETLEFVMPPQCYAVMYYGSEVDLN